MINLQPTECNICSGKVVYISNAKIYGKQFGSGYCYLCTDCKAYVGTHEPRPHEAYGILADEEMRELKKQCHSIFDPFWSNEEKSRYRRNKRHKLYKKLAQDMEIPEEECHFGYFDKDKLKKAMVIIRKWDADI